MVISRDPFKTIGSRIRVLRENSEETQGDLARVLGYEAATIGRYEAGERRIMLPDLIRVADHYGVSVNYFLNRETEEDRYVAELKRIGEDAERLLREIQHLKDSIALPIYGSIPAGWPEDVEQESLGTFSIPKHLVHSPDAFWLKVNGWSLEGAGISDGDLILVDPGLEWKDGDVIAVRLMDGRSLARRAYREGRKIRLEAAKSGYPPIIIDNDEMYYGVVTKMVKDVR